MQKLNKNDLIFLAKTCREIENFEGMLDYMKELISLPEELSKEDRKLFLIALKKLLNYKKVSYTKLIKVEEKKSEELVKNLSIFQNYKKKLQIEIKNFCDEIIKIKEDRKNQIIDSDKNFTDTVFFTYIGAFLNEVFSEVVENENLEVGYKKTLDLYKEAWELAIKELDALDVVRLEAAEHLSYFYKDKLKNKKESYKVAKVAFDEAMDGLDNIFGCENSLYEQTKILGRDIYT